MLNDEVLKLILKRLNLVEDEEFEITFKNTIIKYKGSYRININGLELKSLHSNDWVESIKLDELLLGKLRIIKPPFIPKSNQRYYYPIIESSALYGSAINLGWAKDMHRIKHELCFKTRKEVIEISKEILRFLNKGGK